MAMRLQIECINKTNRMSRHERIARIGGKNPDRTPWSLSEDEAIQGMIVGKWSFFVSVNGKTADVEIAEHSGRKYLRTKPDGTPIDNLLSLPEC